MQIVFLSKRPEILRDTLTVVLRQMTFVESMIVVIPGDLQSEFEFVRGLLPVTFIHDETLIPGNGAKLDHQSRDYQLRTALTEQPAVAAEFLMSDDDARPLTRLHPEFFKENGKYHSFYFYDLADWIYNTTDFDVGQQNSYQVLKYLGYAHLSYASHMPQIINKDILHASKLEFSDYADKLGLCEWSTYFNFAYKHHSQHFHQPQTYKTLCWPECVSCWPKALVPDEYVFENFSPQLYAKHGPFSNLEVCVAGDDDLRFAKILAWYRHELSVLHGSSVDNSAGLRKVGYQLVRPLRRLKDVLFQRERTQLLRQSIQLQQIKSIVEKKL